MFRMKYKPDIQHTFLQYNCPWTVSQRKEDSERRIHLRKVLNSPQRLGFFCQGCHGDCSRQRYRRDLSRGQVPPVAPSIPAPPVSTNPTFRLPWRNLHRPPSEDYKTKRSNPSIPPPPPPTTQVKPHSCPTRGCSGAASGLPSSDSQCPEQPTCAAAWSHSECTCDKNHT